MKKLIFPLLFILFFLVAPNSKFLGSSFSYFQEKEEKETLVSEEKEKKESVKILAFGDMMLGRYVNTLMQKNGYDYPFLKIKDILKEHDLVLTNLEGPITDINLEPKNYMKFRFEKDVLDIFKSII